MTGSSLSPAIRAVIFDVYGTLLDSAAGERPPLDVSLAELLREPRPRLLEDLRSAIEKAHAASPFPHPEVDIRKMWSEVLPAYSSEEIERFARAAEDRLSPSMEMPGAAATLRSLHSAGVLLGIISNAQFYTEAVMQRCLGSSLEELGFDSLLSLFSWQHGRAKPDPWLFEQMRELLLKRSIPPQQVIYAGNDVVRDIHPANACGFKSALLISSPDLRLHGTTLENCGATYLIRSLEDLAGLI